MKITREQIFNILALANDDFKHYGNQFMIKPITLMNAKYKPLLEILALNNGAKVEDLILPLAELFTAISVPTIKSRIVSFSETKGFCPWDSVIDQIIERNEKIVETTEKGKAGKRKGDKNYTPTKNAVYQVWLKHKNMTSGEFEAKLRVICSNCSGGFRLSGDNGYEHESEWKQYQFSNIANFMTEFRKNH